MPFAPQGEGSQPEPSAEELEAAMREAGLHRLVTRWRTLASRIEPYAAPAARAYEQAADDLEAEIKAHPTRVDALVAFRQELVAALAPLPEGGR